MSCEEEAFPKLTKASIARVENPIVVDTRKTEDRASATEANVVPGSLNIPYDKENDAFDVDQLENLGVAKDAAVLVHCYGGNNAKLVCKHLTAAGFTNVSNGVNAGAILAARAHDNNVLIRQFFDRESCTYTYLLVDKATRDAVLIDPVIELVDRDIEALESVGAKLLYVLNTHVHADHVTGTGVLKQKYAERDVAVKSVISKASGAQADLQLEDGDVISFGHQTLVSKNTPGHTPGCVTYMLNNNTHAFCGDTLLIRGCGRTDFQGGDPATLYDSVWVNLFSMPDSTVLYPAHDYNGRLYTTVGEEKKFNPRLSKSKDEFVELMLKRFDGSKYPKKIDAALPANMQCGVY
jgi:sulfur dioxygenase